MKEIYQSAEDAWYALLDKVQKVVPIYAIVDPLDKAVPSFIVFLLAILAIAGFIGYALFIPNEVQLSIETVDAEGNAIAQVPLTVKYAGETKTISTDDDGKALMKAQVGQSVRIQSNPAGYAPFDQIFAIEKETSEIRVQFQESAQPKTKTLLFVTGNNKSTAGKTITAELSCSSGKKVEPKTQTTTNGSLSVSVPSNCGTLNVVVKALGFKSNPSVTLAESESEKTISLEPLVIDKGTVEVSVFDGNASIDYAGLEVTLFDEDTGQSAKKEIVSSGKAKFESVPVGSYYATLQDDSGNYAAEPSEPFELQKNKTQRIQLNANKTIKGTISVRATEKESETPVPNARVTIRLNGKAVAEQSTSANGTVSFSLTEFGNYLVQLSHELYAGKESTVSLNASNANASIPMALEKCSASQQNCGNVRVMVLDEDGKKVENAEVLLYNEETSYLAPYDSRFSDVNGIARFSNVGDGTYYAKARKYPAEAQSAAQRVNASRSTEFLVNMVIGNGTIKIKVLDSDGKIVAFPRVEFRTESGTECGARECVSDGDASGIAQKSFKADKRVFAIVSKEGLESAITPFDQLLPNKTIERAVTLQFPRADDRARIEFKGLFQEGKPAIELKAGKTYNAQFELFVPQGLESESVGMFIRAGEQALMENDVVSLKTLNAPSARSVRGTAYHPPAGTTEDDGYLTLGQSNWIDLQWEEASAGSHLIEVELGVSAQARPNQAIPLHYRAYSVSGEIVLRDPTDASLGNALDSIDKQSRYASSYNKEFKEGERIGDCGGAFCYTAERLLNQETGLYQIAPYHLSVSAPYTLSFSVTNNSEKTLNDAELRFMNSSDRVALDDAVRIESYEVLNADAAVLQDSALNAFQAGGIELGNFSKNKEVQAKFRLLPEKVQSTQFIAQIVSGGEIVFEQSIPTPVVSSDEMELRLQPDFLGSMVSNTVNATVISGELPLGGARIQVTQKSPDLTEHVVSTQYTLTDGTTEFFLPASINGTSYEFKATKTDFAPQTVSLRVDENIIETDPIELQYALNPRTARAQSIDLTVYNKIGHDIRFNSAQWTGSVQEFLNLGSMNAQIAQLSGVPIASNESIAFPMNAVLSPQAVIVGSRSLDGSVKLSVSEPVSGASWDYLVPYRARVGFGPGVDNRNCLVSSITEFSGSTQGNRIQKEFSLKNECLVDGSPVAVENLQAKMTLSGENAGRYQITFRKRGGQSFTETLSEVNPTVLIPRVEAGEELDGIVSFIAFPEMQGKKSQASIQISAKTQTDSGVESINTIRPFNSAIHVIDLKQCVRVSQGLLQLGTGDSGSVDVSTNDCAPQNSNVRINIRLCENDGGGCDEIEVLPGKSFSLRGEGESKTITVNRLTVPGLHGVKVEANLQGTQDWVLLGMVRVLFKPKSGFDDIQLDKYEVDLPTLDSQSALTVTNSDYIRKVSVESKKKNWRGWDNENLSKHQAINCIQGIGSYGMALTGEDFRGAAIAGAGAWLTAFVVEWISVATAATYTGTIGAAAATAASAASVTGWGLAAVAVYLAWQYADAVSLETHELYQYGQRLGIGCVGKPKEAQASLLSKNGSPVPGIEVKWDDPSHVATKINVKDLTKSQEIVPLIFQRTPSTPNSEKISFGTLNLQVKAPCYDDPQYQTHPTNWELSSGCGTFTNTYEYRVLVNISSDSATLYFQEENPLQRKETASLAPIETVPEIASSEKSEDALKKISLNWNWSKIDYDSCDAINPNGIYCDATQFTIASIKRLKILKEWFEANDNDFQCPINGFDEYLEKSTQVAATNSQAQVAISRFDSEFDADQNDLTIRATVVNTTTKDLDITLHTWLEPIDGELLDDGSNAIDQCVLNGSIEAKSSKVVSCTLQNIPQDVDTCQVTFKLETESGVLTDDGYGGTFTCKNLVQTERNKCWLPKASYVLPLYLDQRLDYFGGNVRQKNVVWTDEIKDLDDLNRLLHYDARLLKDSFSPLFIPAFIELHQNREFFNVPLYYSDPTDGFEKYLKEGGFSVQNKFTDDWRIPMAGVYEIEMVFYGSNDFSFFYDNKTVSETVISFYRSPEKQEPTTPLHAIPFASPLGWTTQGWQRGGYGTTFEGFNLKVNNQPNPLTTFQERESVDLDKFTVVKRDDLTYLNKDLFNRGIILSIDLERKEIVWSPSYATPVLMKVDAVATSRPFEAAYWLNVNGKAENLGQSSGFWSGANSACKDFSGKNSAKAFNVTPDQKSANRLIRENAYALKWGNAAKSGSAFVKTIYYTPRSLDASIQSASNNVSFYTPNESFDSSVSLNGVRGMRHNSPGNDEFNSIDSIEDVLELVKEGTVGVSDYGNRMEFWWNPEALYAMDGTQASVSAQSSALVPGTDCLN